MELRAVRAEWKGVGLIVERSRHLRVLLAPQF